MRHDAGKAGERENIDGVVLEHRQQTRGLLRAQVLEVDEGNQRAGNVAVALHAQHLVLQVDQTAAIEAQFPQPARAVQQIEMLAAREGRPRPMHAIARFEQRLIEGCGRCR